MNKTLLTIFEENDLLNPKCWCGKFATVTCVTCLVDLCSKHSEDEHILRGHETSNLVANFLTHKDCEV